VIGPVRLAANGAYAEAYAVAPGARVALRRGARSEDDDVPLEHCWPPCLTR